MNYGISNKIGQTTKLEAIKILFAAKKHGIDLIDTACDYGTSEEVLGELIQQKDYFRIITKVPSIKEKDKRQASYFIEKFFFQSLNRLKKRQIYGLLVHDANDLIGSRSDNVWEKLQEFKQKNLVKKIGVSVYTPSQLGKILKKFSVDLVQIPLNPLDQRFTKNDFLKKLKNLKIEIHVRSIFLQGLLLMNSGDVGIRFTDKTKAIFQYHDFLKRNRLTPLQAALKFVCSIEEIDCAIVGINSCSQFMEIIETFYSIDEKYLDFSPLACSDEKVINPSLWKQQPT